MWSIWWLQVGGVNMVDTRRWGQYGGYQYEGSIGWIQVGVGLIRWIQVGVGLIYGYK